MVKTPETDQLKEEIENLRVGDELIAEGKTNLFDMPGDMPQWMAVTIRSINKFSHLVGHIVCWLTLPLCFAMVFEIIARYFFLAPTVWAYDISRMLYGALFMLGAGFALLHGVHIRADFIYRNWQPRTQAIVDTALYICCYFPGMILFFFIGYEFAFDAWDRGELGMDTAWMPHMGPIKSAIPIGTFFLILQGISELLQCFYTLKHNRWPCANPTK